MAAMESEEIIRLNYKEYKHWKREKFTHFVSNMLLLRNRVDLHTFQLNCESECWHLLNYNDLRTWIGYAVKQNVKVLDVNLYQYDRTVLPCCIFTSRSLEELKLQMGKAPYKDYEHEGLVLPDIIELPSLKRLILRDVEVSTLEDFVAQSPGLEDVHLIHSAQHLECIKSKVLKRLTVDGLFDREKGLTIAAPNLIHFECAGWPLEDILWQERPSLESARIDTGYGCTFDGQSDFTGIVLHAKTLALFGSDIKVMLEKELPTCSEFDNLTTLEIGGWCLMDDFNVVLRFLQLSPRLEELILKHRKGAKKGAEMDSMPVAEMTFQCPHLKTVTIQCSKDDDDIEKMVNAMVANSVSLEKIHVNFYEDIKWSHLAERKHLRQEEAKGQSVLEKKLKKKQEWVDDTVDSENDEDEMEETFGYEDDDLDDYF